MLNAYNMYLVKNGNFKMCYKDFHQKVVKMLLARLVTLTHIAPGRRVWTVIDRLGAVAFIEHHYLDHVPAVSSCKNSQRRCIVCSQTTKCEKKKTLGTTWCPECKVELYLEDCFCVFHTRKKY